MDFDANLKREILSEIKSERYYLLGLINTLAKLDEETKSMTMTHVMYEIAMDIARVVKSLYRRADVEIAFVEPHGNIKTRSFEMIIDPKTTKEIISDYDLIEIDKMYRFRKLNPIIDANDRIALLQGVFLARGRVFIPHNDKEKKTSLYQLEMTFRFTKLKEYIKDIINSLNISIKEWERRDKHILYINDSETISDFIALMGASSAVMELQSLIIERDIRNNANRAVNCSIANISKTVDAASKQIDAIKIIDKRQGLDTLPEKLKELAYLRLQNPEATLSDLATLLSGEVTKSGINHRMRKLIEIAEQYKIT